MRCLKPGFIPSHDIRGRSETRFDDSVSRPDPHVVTVGPVGRLGPRRFGALCASAFFSAVFPSRRPYAACLHLASLLPFFLASYWGALALGVGIVRLLHTERLASSARGFGYFPAGVPGVFAFPARREDNIYVYEFYVNKNFIYVYIESKNTADTTKARRSRLAGTKKAPHGRGRRNDGRYLS